MAPQIFGKKAFEQIVKALEIAGLGPSTNRTTTRIYDSHHTVEIHGLTFEEFLTILEAGFDVLKASDSYAHGGTDRYLVFYSMLEGIWRLHYPNFGTVENWFADHYPLWNYRWDSPKILTSVKKDFMEFAQSQGEKK